MTALTVDLLDRDFTVLSTDLAQGAGRAVYVQRARDGLGRGTLTVPTDHDDIDDMTHSRVLRWNLDGTAVAATVIRSRPYTRVPSSESKVLLFDAEVTMLDGPGGLALLGESGRGGIKGAVVEGLRSSGRMPFGWVAPEWDTTSWTASVGFGTYANPDPHPREPRTLPPDFPCDTAAYIAHRAPESDANGSYVHDPFEKAWFRQKFDFGAYDHVRVYWHADNQYRVYSDGEFAYYDNNGTRRISEWKVDDPGDDYTLAAWVRNNDPSTTSNPMHALFAIYEVLPDGSNGQLLAKSQDGDGVWSDTEPVGVTAGYVMSRLVDVAQSNRGGEVSGSALPGITYTFTDTHDSSETPQEWSTSAPVVWYRDGEAYWPVLQMMLQQFGIDASMAPDGELVLLDDAGSDVGIDLTDGTVALSAEVDREPAGGNAVRVQTPDGAVWRQSSSRITAEGARTEDAVAFGTVDSVAETETTITHLLADMRAKVRQTIETAGPAGAVPLIDFGVADTVGVRVADGGNYFDFTVEAVGVASDRAGKALFDVDVERRQ